MTKEYLKEFELTANAFTLKAIGFTAALFGVIWVLNFLSIFIVEQSIMNIGFFGSILIMPSHLAWPAFSAWAIAAPST